mmetsp:Transcript_25997/g.32418  ORF Transcript_25997/g.32418 Transcript_25997/m.32418 type:complete len:102 (+) Transcript_25997:83-388(+)
MLRLDLYKQPFRLLLPDGKNEYRTFVGSVLSLLTVCIVLAYGSFKVLELVSLSNYKIQTREEEKAFAETDPLDESQDFVIAAGIIGRFGERVEVPPEIGKF